jgi:hypothetical protein
MLFKATTRRAKLSRSFGFEGFVHEAKPLTSHTEDGWNVVLPTPHGAALAYGVTTGPFGTETEARAYGTMALLADGWRETRQEAEADMAAEIEYRSTHRRDGSPRRS